MVDIRQKLLDNSKLDPDTGCRLWAKGLFRDGYGQTWYQGKNYRAHRLSYKVFVGPISDGLCILHSCHTPTCINADHLRVGTRTDNAEDRDLSGRQARGEAHGRTKLNWEKVRIIRQKYSSGDYTQAALSDLFGVSQKVVSDIVRGKTWKESASL